LGVFVALTLLAAPAVGRAADAATLRLSGVNPGGLRVFATDSWGTFGFELTNLTDTDRHARVVAFYAGQPDVQYGREVWVPAHAALRSWMLVGPVAGEHPPARCEVEILLYDRTDGTDRLIRPGGDEAIRARGESYRKREPFTAVLLDEDAVEEYVPGRLPRPDSPAKEALALAHAFRHARNLSELVHPIRASLLPPIPEGFDGMDHIVIASSEITRNPAGLRALRQWLENGGKVWVMLDLVDPRALAPLLGEALDFQVVDRVPLTRFRVESSLTDPRLGPPPTQERERPVDFVRVLLPREERPRHTIDGWPVWFTRPVGRGKVVFTALGPRGWHRPRRPRPDDPPSPFEHYPNLPVLTEPQALVQVAEELHPAPEPDPFRPEALRPLLESEVGYSVVGRGSVLLVAGAFLLAALVVGLALRRSRRPELVGWLAPVAALGAAGVFVALAESSRRAVPPTVAVVQMVQAVPGSEEASVHGLLAAYRPDSGPAEVGAERGGFFEMDMAGLAGKSRRLVLTDLGAWHWEDLALPAGVRLASFHYTAPTGEPLAAVAHFGPDGLEGKLAIGPFQDLSDALLAAPNGRNLAVRLRPDGTFRAGTADALPTGQFLAGAVLSDRQQRRQDFYRQALKPTSTGRPEGPPVLMAWAAPIDMHFTAAPDARTAGSALLVVPLRLERPTPGERVTIPGPLVPYRRLNSDGRPVRPALEGEPGSRQHLRFQLPAAVLPFQVERARLLARIEAPGRRVTVAGLKEGAATVLHEVESPLDPIALDIADPQWLGLDDDGGLHLEVAVGDLPEGRLTAGPKGDKWTIEYLELEVTGRGR
jgi:hypothetical protein